jgi:hypothetical protein
MNTKPISINDLCARLLAAAVLACAVPAAALAGDLVLAPSPALRCLSLPRGAADRPEYPPTSLALKEGGRVRVQLEFLAPDKAPRIKLPAPSHVERLERAVKEHVEQYRVPCMQIANGSVTLLQEYDFDPDGRTRVVASPPRDSADPERAAMLRCITHIVPNSIPHYPMRSREREEEGTLLAKIRFGAPDQPPTLEWMARPTHALLRMSVEDYVAGLRMPCLRNGPVEAIRAYKFYFSDGVRSFLRDSTLLELLGAAKDLKTPVSFDFNAMSCPFDVRLTYLRPFARNAVEQLDTLVPAREPLLEWLQDVTLAMNEAQTVTAFTDSLIVTVPCGKLDL